MDRTEKHNEVESLREAWSKVQNAYLLDYRGLKVSEASELRRRVRETNSKYRVVKNRLAILAARETPLKVQESLFDGMTAVVWNETDPLDLAKTLHEFAKTAPIVIKGGIVEGRLVGAAEIEGITKLPARPDLIATFAGMLRSPLVKFVSVLAAPVRDLAIVLKQVADRKKQ